MKKSLPPFIFGLLLGLVAASLLFTFLEDDQAGGTAWARQLKVAHTLPASHPVHAGMEHMGQRLEEISGGRLSLVIYPSGQLGSETQTIEQLQSGTLDIAKSSAAPIGNFLSLFKVFSLPYLFRDEAHYWNVLDGEIGQGLLEEMSVNDAGQSSGMRGLTYYDSGSRNFYGKRPVLSPADLKGVKIRVQNDPVAMDMVSALGGAPTPVAWGELYTALQQGVVDGAENNPPSFVTSRHFEVCKDFSFDHHSRVPDILLISLRTWEDLSGQEREWLLQAARESSVFQREAWAAAVEESLDLMRSEGVEIREVDILPFIEATQSVRDKYALGSLKELMTRIGNVQ
ncbi:MAG: TRAP transporter substrate-binding protein [Opitutales bacterium]|jgi:tripartite ATP-independent transporter DctP family solute receptor